MQVKQNNTLSAVAEALTCNKKKGEGAAVDYKLPFLCNASCPVRAITYLQEAHFTFNPVSEQPSLVCMSRCGF